MTTGEELLRFFNWRSDVHDQNQAESDAVFVEEFAERADEVREQIVFLLENGLTVGAETSSGAMALVQNLIRTNAIRLGMRPPQLTSRDLS